MGNLVSYTIFWLLTFLYKQVQATYEALDELRQFKAAQVVQTQAFVKNLNEINENMNKDVAEVRADSNKLWTFLEKN